jgi:hypothetical protein
MSDPPRAIPRMRGVAHVHSTYSFDGRLSLEELAGFFQERDIQFVLMSEHVESLDPGKIRSFIDDCKRYSSETFLLIPGIEIDALHGLYYNVEPVSPWSDNESLARQLVAAGAMAVVSHPVKVKNDVPPITASMVEGVEIWNSRHDGKLAPDGKVIRFWRSLRQRLGRQLLPLCGIDFHKRDDFIPLMFEVACETLDQRSVMAAIRAGNYQIVRSPRPVPLNFASGRLSAGYRVYSQVYRVTYELIYTMHRAVVRSGFRAPKGLRLLLRRIF